MNEKIKRTIYRRFLGRYALDECIDFMEKYGEWCRADAMAKDTGNKAREEEAERLFKELTEQP